MICKSNTPLLHSDSSIVIIILIILILITFNKSHNNKDITISKGRLYHLPEGYLTWTLMPLRQSQALETGTSFAGLLIMAVLSPIVRADMFEQCCCLLLVCSFRNKHLPERAAAAAAAVNKLSQEVLLIG